MNIKLAAGRAVLAAVVAAPWAGCCPRPHPRTRGSARRCRCRASCSSTASPSRPRRRADDDQDRDDRPERVRDRLVRAAAARVDAAGPADRLGRQRRDHEGDVDGRQHADRARTRCFSSSPSRRQAKTYTFQVQQTYSDGSIVNWAGPESSAAPAPTIEAKARSAAAALSVLTIIALIVGRSGCSPAGSRWSARVAEERTLA